MNLSTRGDSPHGAHGAQGVSGRNRLGAMRRHILPLACVAGACAAGQIAVLMQTPLVAVRADSSSYTQMAENIFHRLQFFDALRTPGYPTFLALIFAFTGGEHLIVVVVAQTALTLLAIGEIYLLTYRIARSRWQAAAVAGLTGASPFVTSWERCILPEALSFWLVVTLMLVLERYMTTQRSGSLILLTVCSVLTIFTRPQYLFLPFLIVCTLMLKRRRERSWARRAREFMFLCVLPIVLVGAYSVTNGAVTGYVGLSDIVNLNLFGKVIEYNMIDMSGADASPSLARFHAELDRAAANWDPRASEHDSWIHQSVTDHLWRFVLSHPAYDANHRAIYG